MEANRVRRAMLGDWVFATTGHRLENGSDEGFCEGLWDGVLLCQLLTALSRSSHWPADASSPLHGQSTVTASKNHTLFVGAAMQVGLKPGDLFALEDLGRGGTVGDPSKVIACLNALMLRTDVTPTRRRTEQAAAPSLVDSTGVAPLNTSAIPSPPSQRISPLLASVRSRG
jgi:hypothetical protein